MRTYIISLVFAAITTIFSTNAFAACTSAQIDVLGDGTQCETAKFTITTTNLNANDVFDFLMTATGTFYVDWGDGTVDTIVRSDTTMTNYSHTYAGGGVKTIRMSGTATGYAVTTEYNTDKVNNIAAIRFFTDAHDSYMIAAISGSLGTIFPTLGSGDTKQPRFAQTFQGARIQSIPENLFSGIYGGATWMFNQTFSTCVYLTSIPSNLFTNITNATGCLFYYTFAACISLQSIPEDLFKNLSGNGDWLFEATFGWCSSLTTIPENLFASVSGARVGMFQRTFHACSSLTSIPENLFASISGSANRLFRWTFDGCTGLTGIPANLFRNITGGQYLMFNNTFRGCTNLSGYIPPSMFAGLIANGAPVGENMWTDTFTDTNIATSCPAGTVQYTTGYESYWGGRVACMPECSGGQYYNLDSNACGPCSAGTYSTGNTWVCSACTGATYSGPGAASCTACPTGYNYNTTNGKSSPTQCQTNCAAGQWISAPGTLLPNGYTRIESLTSHRLNGAPDPFNAYSDIPYIDTGIKLDVNSRIETQFEIGANSAGYNYNVFGANNGRYYNDGEIALFWHNRGHPIFEPVYPISNSTSTVLYQPQITPDTVYTISYDKNYFTMNGASQASNWYSDYVGTRTLRIFATNRDDVTWGSNDLTMYYFRLYDNGRLVFDGIPARRNSDGELGMYDTVTGNFFTNAGSGTFIAGPDVGGGTGACTSVGTGYSGSGGVANFGSTLPRTANTITINWAGTNGVFETGQCTYDGGISTPTTIPTKRGHVFAGWKFVE